MTLTDRGGTPALVVNAKDALKEGSARAMTMQERLKVHADIERQNREKLEAWKQEETREANVRLAREELQKLTEEGVIA